MKGFAEARTQSGTGGWRDPRPAGGPSLVRASSGRGHSVQFYECETFLAEVVGDFLAAGFAAGQPLLVIATPAHREAFVRHLAAAGFPVDAALRLGRLTLLDAEETGARVMLGSEPDAERFHAIIGGALERSRAGFHPDVAVRVYGEIVDLLWKADNARGAIKLEELWNELASTHDFSLLCAYDMANFSSASDAAQFLAVCEQHAHVVPTERYTSASDDARLVEISRLQQRAQALEAEVAQRAALEAQLRESLEERDRLLAREQAARAEAEAANRAKSEFLAVMSHELRTPLNAIGGYTQLIDLGIHGPVTDAQRDALARVQRSQRHLLALINDILNLARTEAGRVEYALEDVALAPLVANVTATVTPLLAAKELTCETPASDADALAPHMVRADAEKVHQILLNLITNAIKFTPAHGRITVEATACPEAPAMACVHVRDTGIGIPPGRRQRIFDPFVQLASRPLNQADGVGLGLAISRDLARGMGGDLTVTSTVGVGSSFTLTLPRAS
ncbi:MAG TPA: ATP-binding protein [Gemmatimonadaceae bacterium]|nr:ATP-binding protein [Gemmatimonadaceae bacterium]